MSAKRGSRPQPGRRSRARTVVVALLGVGFVAGAAYLTRRYGEISLLIEQRHAALSSSIYSAPHAIRVGDDVVRSHLLDRLRALSYSQVSAAEAPGQYTKGTTQF